MPKLSANIYGADETAMARAVSSDALDVETPGINIANYWDGDTFDQSAKSHGGINKGDKVSSAGDHADVKATHAGGGKDKRACTEGNHGKQGCHGS